MRLPAGACALLCATALATLGCGAAGPRTAADMASEGTGDALVAYLGQAGATAAVCDQRSVGPRFRSTEPRDLEPLADALLDGAVRPAVWQRCVTLWLESTRPEHTTPMLDALAHAYRRLLGDGDVETDPVAQAKLGAIHRVLLLRPRGTAPTADEVAPDVEALRAALASGALGPVATKHGRELLRVIDLERGQFDGAPLTVATLDALEKKRDEAFLRQVERRAPDATLAREARRRIVRLHLAASKSPAVRADPDGVLERVMETGRNAVDLGEHPVTAAWIDDESERVRRIVVKQDVFAQTATLLGEGPGRRVGVMPTIDLRGALFARAKGVDEPLTVCAPPDALDVTPCIAASDVRPRVPILRVDEQGLLHFVERLAARDAVRLVYDTPNVPVPFDIGGKTALTVEWPIAFAAPPPLVFSGPTSGRGPDLQVKVERRYAPRLIFEVESPLGKLTGVVEEGDLARFAIASQGGAGPAGVRGANGAAGSPGMNGMSASCPGSPGGQGGQGGNGSPGGSGGPGGPGGDGGDVRAVVSCVTGDCGAFARRVGQLVQSLAGPGGPGGEGGSGGPGGPGGMGGSGASCTDSNGQYRYVSGGSSGSRGSDGAPGSRGPNGPDGEPGRVQIDVMR